MTINVEWVNQFVSMQEELRESGIIGIDLFDKEVQVKQDAILELPNIQYKKRDCSEYPHEFYSVINGVTYFSIAKEETFERCPELRNFVKEVVSA